MMMLGKSSKTTLVDHMNPGCSFVEGFAADTVVVDNFVVDNFDFCYNFGKYFDCYFDYFDLYSG